MRNNFLSNKEFEEKSVEEIRYSVLKAKKYSEHPFRKESIGDGMGLLEEVITGYWKTRYLLNHNTKCAYEFLSSDEHFVSITPNDINWERLKDLPDNMLARVKAKRLSAHFPTIIRGFENGVSQVSWQINPDGYYYMDNDGFGMTNDEEITLYGFIDKTGKVLVKFQTIKNYGELKEMKQEAEMMIKNNDDK